MASTNTNTNSNVLTTDIYEIADFIDTIRSNTISEVDATAAMVGIFGYMSEVHSQSLQDVLIKISETSNEAIATRAKFSKNILAHAMNAAITDINSHPAMMTMMIYLPIDYMMQNLASYDSITGKSTFILSHEVPFNIDDHEFHLDYDVIINRTRNSSGTYVYTAMYDLFEPGTTQIKQRNSISNISNPYITTIIQTTVDSEDYVAFSARLHQVKLDVIEKDILTDTDIENKAITFEFDNQLATFDVDVVESDGTVRHLTPIYAGLLDYTVEDGQWCYYEYITENCIRILFSRDSYIPGLNATVKVNVQISEGSGGNFTYTTNFRTALKSDTYDNYNGMYALIYPLMNGISNGGKDKKSVADLKKIIPRETSSRGSVINTTDLNNFFNSINDNNTHLYFYKKKDNPFERLYYTYLIMKKRDVVFPTNTLDLKIQQSDFKKDSENNNLIITPGTVFYYYDHGSDYLNDYCTVVPPEYEEGLDPEQYPYPMVKNADGQLVRVFEYVSPFLMTIDDDLIISYLFTVMNENKTFKFESINTASDTQFIATNMDWTRKYVYKDENGNEQFYEYKYNMKMDLLMNTNQTDYKLCTVDTDANGNKFISDCRVKVIMVLYADSTDRHPYRYLEGYITEYDDLEGIFTFSFDLDTDDMMDSNNRINILNIYNAKPEAYQKVDSMESSHGYLSKNTFAKIYILADFGLRAGDEVDGVEIDEDEETIVLFGDDGIGNRTEIENIVPTKQDLIDEFLRNEIYYDEDGNQINVISIMRSKPEYMEEVFLYNGNEIATTSAILRYLRNNQNSDFVQNVLLQDEYSKLVIESYNFIDLARYTLCNVLSVDGGIDFYHDYSKIMTGVVNIAKVNRVDIQGNPVYKAIPRSDSYGNPYNEYKPLYVTNDDGTPFYNYTISRIPMIKNGFLVSEADVQEFIFDIEERRKYIEECMLVLEDTFGLDFKFVNTYGPSKRFYYILPNEKSYYATAILKRVYIYNNTDAEEKIDALTIGQQVKILSASGIWGYIESPTAGYVRLSELERVKNYINNVAVKFKFALEAETSADKNIGGNIIYDIKNYVETINEINEIHVPNIITLITNNFREQIKYFEFLDVNGYGAACQHLYLDDTEDVDTCPEFINIESSDDSTHAPVMEITVY